jgi:hypothetical protein
MRTPSDTHFEQSAHFDFNFDDHTPSPIIPVSRKSATGKRPVATLYVDVVPSSAWYSNLRAELTEREWKACQKYAFKKAGYCCEICSGRGPKWPVECHERWEFNEKTGVQVLKGLEALCPDCHETTHIGLAKVRGRFEQAFSHLMRVNGWTEAKARAHVQAAGEDFHRRSSMPWRLDASLLLSLPLELGEASRRVIERHAALARAGQPDPASARQALLEQCRESKPVDPQI